MCCSLGILDALNIPITIPAIGAMTEVLLMAKELYRCQPFTCPGYRRLVQGISDGEETCLQLALLTHAYSKLISGSLEVTTEGYIRWGYSDELKAKGGNEAIAIFEMVFEDLKQFLRSHQRGNWLSRLAHINKIEEQTKGIPSRPERRRPVTPATTPITVHAFCNHRLPPISVAKRLDESDICIINHPRLQTVRACTFWDEVTEAQIGGQVRLVQIYDTEGDAKSFLWALWRMINNRASNLPVIYGYSASIKAPFIVLSSSPVTGFFEYLTAQIRLDKSHALLTAWSMMIDIKDAATFLADHNPGTFSPTLSNAVTNVVVGRDGKVLVVCPLSAPSPMYTQRSQHASNLSNLAIQFWLPYFNEWREWTPPSDSCNTLSRNTAEDLPARVRVFKALGLALHGEPEYVLASKTNIPKTMEEAKRFLHRRWPRAHKQRYSTWRGKQYDNPVVGDFGVFEGPEPSTFRKLGNIASEFGGISTYPFTSFWCTGPQMPDRGVYQYTITPGSKQDDENRRADWMLSTVWTCELVDRDLEWDILLLSVGRLADQYGVAPDKIVLVTRTMSSFDLTASRRKGLRSIVDAAEIALHYNIHLDDYGHLSHHYWSYDGKLLSSEEASEHALAMAKFGLPYPEVEDIEYGVGVTNCLQVRKEDLLP